MKSVVASIFAGTFLFYITFLPVWLFSNNPVDTVEEYTIEGAIEHLPKNMLPFDIDPSTGMNWLGYEIDETLEDLLDDHNATDISFESVSPNSIFGKLSQDSIGLIKRMHNDKLELVKVRFTLEDDISIDLLFLSAKQSIFPPKFSEFALPVAANVEAGGDVYFGDIFLAGHIVRELSHEDRASFASKLLANL